VTSPGFYGEPTASSQDPGLSHPRALGVQIITNAGLSLERLCIWFGSNWCKVRIGVDECVCRSEFNSQRYIAQKWTEGPAELIKEVVLNPQPDLEGVPVEVNEEAMMQHYFEWWQSSHQVSRVRACFVRSKENRCTGRSAGSLRFQPRPVWTIVDPFHCGAYNISGRHFGTSWCHVFLGARGIMRSDSPDALCLIQQWENRTKKLPTSWDPQSWQVTLLASEGKQVTTFNLDAFLHQCLRDQDGSKLSKVFIVPLICVSKTRKSCRTVEGPWSGASQQPLCPQNFLDHPLIHFQSPLATSTPLYWSFYTLQ